MFFLLHFFNSSGRFSFILILNQFKIEALFEAWSVNLYKLNCQEVEILKERKEIVKQKIIDLTNAGKFDTPMYRSTGNLKTVLDRLNEIGEIIKSVLQ